jgi:hypothetical protein
MIDLLKNQFINYLIGSKVHLPHFDSDKLTVKAEVISEIHFDIMDKAVSICQALNSGSATYYNPESKCIQFIDFEDFVNQLPVDLSKDIKRCDFIAYDKNGTSFFLLNELSQSISSKNKLNDARQQLHRAAFLFSSTNEIKAFMEKFHSKKCIFSNKSKLLSCTPEHVADAFSEIQNYLPEPIMHNYQPITKLGFELIETAIVEV